MGSEWEGGLFSLRICFPSDYPSSPPICKFPKGFFHTNVYLPGTVCDSILRADAEWLPCISMREVLQAIQSFFLRPNPLSPSQEEAYHVIRQNPGMYHRRVKEQAQKYAREAFFTDDLVSGFGADRRDWAQYLVPR